MKSFKEIQQEYDFELGRIEKEIKKKKPKSVLIQMPEGLKPYSLDIVDFLQEKFPKIEFRISLGTCFGACDIPLSDCDLIIQFGHARWR